MTLAVGLWGDLPALTLAGLFAVAMAAGFVDSIAGGGGLLCVPALLAAGLTPAAMLATNKLQGCFGTLSASINFVRAGHVDPRDMAPVIATVFVGAGAGAVAVQRLDPAFLGGVLPLLLIAVAGYFLAAPGIGGPPRRRILSPAGFALTLAPLLGFYDGFFGPGTGSFLMLVLVAFVGLDMLTATAETKVLNFTSNLASLLVFLLGGKIVWLAGLVMAVGQFAGARLGSHLVIARGAAVVRPCLVAGSLAITVKLIAGDEANWLHRAGVVLWQWVAT